MHTLIKNLVAFLYTKIDDPNDKMRGEGREWIIEGFPKLQERIYPVIGVYNAGMVPEPLGLGTALYKDTLQLRMGIFCDSKGQYNVNETECNDGWDVVQAIYDFIRPFIEQQDAQFVTWGWTRPIPRDISSYIEDDAVGYLLNWEVRRWNRES